MYKGYLIFECSPWVMFNGNNWNPPRYLQCEVSFECLVFPQLPQRKSSSTSRPLTNRTPLRPSQFAVQRPRQCLTGLANCNCGWFPGTMTLGHNNFAVRCKHLGRIGKFCAKIKSTIPAKKNPQTRNKRGYGVTGKTWKTQRPGTRVATSLWSFTWHSPWRLSYIPTSSLIHVQICCLTCHLDVLSGICTLTFCHRHINMFSRIFCSTLCSSYFLTFDMSYILTCPLAYILAWCPASNLTVFLVGFVWHTLWHLVWFFLWPLLWYFDIEPAMYFVSMLSSDGWSDAYSDIYLKHCVLTRLRHVRCHFIWQEIWQSGEPQRAGNLAIVRRRCRRCRRRRRRGQAFAHNI